MNKRLPGDPLIVRTRINYGTSAKFGAKGFGGAVLGVESKKNAGVAAFWTPSRENTGKGIPRAYPMTSKEYQQVRKSARIIQRKARSMFKNANKSMVSFGRGHNIPHADTATNTPLSRGLRSTNDKRNFYPEVEGWGEQQRKHREGKARKRETPMFQYNEFSSLSGKTVDGTPVPDRLWLIELTSLAKDLSYVASKASKGYNIKAYHVDYATFNYDKLPKKGPSDRAQTKPLRDYSPPADLMDLVRTETGFKGKFKF
jgi:hypothetical protein